MRRSYGQFCGLARALDVVGERWTLLVVRELLLGPRRYKDLLDALPGIGTNLLAARLKDLEREGLVARRRLPPPSGSTVYELTPLGRGLEPVLVELGRWGRQFLGKPPRKRFHGSWLLFALYANFDRSRARGLREDYEIHLGPTVVHARVRDGRLEAGEGPLEGADLVVEADLEGLFQLARGELSLEDALRKNRLRFAGSQEALERFARVFRLGSAATERGRSAGAGARRTRP